MMNFKNTVHKDLFQSARWWGIQPNAQRGGKYWPPPPLVSPRLVVSESTGGSRRGGGALGANAPPAVYEIGGNLHISWNIKKSEQLLCRQVCFKTFIDTQGSKIQRVFRRRRNFLEGMPPPPAAYETDFLDPPVSERRARRRSKALNEIFQRVLKIYLKRPRVRSRSGQGSKSELQDYWPQRPKYQQQRAKALLKYFWITGESSCGAWCSQPVCTGQGQGQVT